MRDAILEYPAKREIDPVLDAGPSVTVIWKVANSREKRLLVGLDSAIQNGAEKLVLGDGRGPEAVIPIPTQKFGTIDAKKVDRAEARLDFRSRLRRQLVGAQR